MVLRTGPTLGLGWRRCFSRGGRFATAGGLLLRLEISHRGLAAETDLTRTLIDAHAFDRDGVAHLGDILGAAHAEVG